MAKFGKCDFYSGNTIGFFFNMVSSNWQSLLLSDYKP